MYLANERSGTGVDRHVSREIVVGVKHLAAFGTDEIAPMLLRRLRQALHVGLGH